MLNIIAYFNSLLDLIFGHYIYLVSPETVVNFFSRDTSVSLEEFILHILRSPHIVFSCFVWSWFAILVFNLLLVYPFNWLRSIIRKCRG